nr:MAG TPA: hypothetical protein [Caudoviricetes sp.]
MGCRYYSKIKPRINPRLYCNSIVLYKHPVLFQ